LSVTTSMSGLNELQAVLLDAQRDVVPEAKKVLSRAALNIKNDARKKVSGIRHAPAYPRSIGYDTAWKGTLGRAEIGPDKDKRQGALGNILEYGTVNNPPYAHLGPALDYEGPNFEKYLGQLGEDLLT
jgi:hypothetical protein